jgi:hypothetical protein
MSCFGAMLRSKKLPPHPVRQSVDKRVEKPAKACQPWLALRCLQIKRKRPPVATG